MERPSGWKMIYVVLGCNIVWIIQILTVAIRNGTLIALVKEGG